MTFGEQTLTGLFVAQDSASDLLRHGNLRDKPLSLHEALFFQAVNGVLETEEVFRASQISDLTRATASAVRRFIGEFVDIDVLAHAGLSIEYESERGRPAQMFGPTDLGKQILGIFAQGNIQQQLLLS